MRATEETRVRSLAASARALSRPEPLFRMLEIAAEEAQVAMRAASVSVSRLVPGTLTVRTIVNVGDLGPGEERWPEDELYVVDEFLGLQLVLDRLQTWACTVDGPETPERDRQLLRQLQKGSSLGAPIVVDGRLWGEFYATRHVGEETFDEVDAAYLEALLAILSSAISRAQREESLEQLAFRDPLTGLLNRRALDEAADEAFVLGAASSRVVTVVTLDINRLKQVNDTLGHVAGDQLIQAVARDLQQAYAPLNGALVARVGGDEFTVLVTGQDPVLVVQVSNELCRRTWKFGPGAGISAGAASVRLTAAHDVSPTQLFAAADRAQYVAKHGRLAITVMSEDFGPTLGDA